MIGSEHEDALRRGYADHTRNWCENLYVYPVISRRSHGLSIGVNLNPDTACNFDCVYCQVDRSITPRVREVDVGKLSAELKRMIVEVRNGTLFRDSAFAAVPAQFRVIRDIAFSGDGEPTTCKFFLECVESVASLKRAAGLTNAKIILITDACYLTRPEVVAALRIIDSANGEVWAKLDAGTEAYFRKINRPNFPLQHVIDNIIASSAITRLVIQSLFLRCDGQLPDEQEVRAFAGRLTDIIDAGGTIDRVQVYTMARPPGARAINELPADTTGRQRHRLLPLSDEEVDRIADVVRQTTGLHVEAFYGIAQP
ncbi:MAG: radical SAM protein [Phycisphaerae bacterium]